MGELILKFEIVIPDFRLLKIVSSKRLVLLLALCDASKRGYPYMVISVTLLWLWAWNPRPPDLKGSSNSLFLMKYGLFRKKQTSCWDLEPVKCLKSVPLFLIASRWHSWVQILEKNPMTSVNASSTVHEFWVTPFFFFFLLLSFPAV